MTWIEMKLKCQEVMETFTFRSQPFLPLSLSPGRNGRAWIHQDCNYLGPCNCSSCSYLGPWNWYHLNIAVPLVFHRSQRGDLWPSPVVASTHLLSNISFLKKSIQLDWLFSSIAEEKSIFEVENFSTKFWGQYSNYLFTLNNRATAASLCLTELDCPAMSDSHSFYQSLLVYSWNLGSCVYLCKYP